MAHDNLPDSVLYVKNGKGGQWWRTARKSNQVHAGWAKIPAETIQKINPSTIAEEYDRYYPGESGSTQDRNALVRLLDKPSQYVWVTVEDGFLWWCTVRDGAQASDEESSSRGHFWLNCESPWSKHSIAGKPLAVSDLPGTVTKVSGFRGTVGMPAAWQDILRIIRGEPDPKIDRARSAREAYENAVKALIVDLHWRDFELLVDLVLTRSGWERLTTLGKTQEGIDLDVENAATNECAFVQIKSTAGQTEFNDYCQRFNLRRERYAKMIFAVHTPQGNIRSPHDDAVQIWAADRLARLVVRLGLGERVEKMRG